MFVDACSEILPTLWFVIPLKRDLHGGVDWRYGGTAFAAGPGGYLFTAAHVTTMDAQRRVPADYIRVVRAGVDYPDCRFYLQQTRNATVVEADAAADTAVLRIDDPPRWFPHVRLSRRTPRIGTPCATLGYSGAHGSPEQGFLVFARGALGMVATAPYEFSENGREFRQIQETDMVVHHGGSGGPVFLSTGEVFGVVRGNLTHAAGEEVRVANLTSLSPVDGLEKIIAGKGVRLESVHRRRWFRWGRR